MTMTELYKPFTAMPKPSPESFLIGGLCVSAGGLWVYAREAWHSKFWENLNWFIGFHVSIWGAWRLVWGV